MAVPNNKELGRVSGGLVLLSTGEWYFCPDWSKGELRWCNSLVAKISMCPCRHFFILRAAKNDFPSDVIYSALAFLDLQFMTFYVLAYFIGEKSSRMAVWFGKFAELRWWVSIFPLWFNLCQVHSLEQVYRLKIVALASKGKFSQDPYILAF